MKSIKKIFLYLSVCVLFLSCSNLLKSQSEKGLVCIRLPGEKQTLARSALVSDKNNLLFEVKVTGDGDFSLSKEARSGEEIEFDLDPGNYLIDVSAYTSEDIEKKFLVYHGSADAVVNEGARTVVELQMNRIPAIDFVKSVWGDLTKNEYNYTWGGDVTNYVPDLKNQLKSALKKGDKANVKIHGIANTDYKGNIEATFANHNNGWTKIATDTCAVDFKAGDELNLSFDLILQNDTSSKEDLIFNLFYAYDELDELMGFNDYSIEFDFNPSFEVVEHFFHVGARLLSIYCKTDVEYNLPDYDTINWMMDYNLWAMQLEGWYDNESYSGEAITKLSAAENTTSNDYYAKLKITTVKNIWGNEEDNEYNYVASFQIRNFARGENGAEFNELPKGGETIKLTFEGVVDQDFNGYLGCDLFEDSVEWTSVAQQFARLEAQAGEKFILYYELPVPKGTKFDSLAHTGFNFFYGIEDIDKEISISDFKVTLYGGKYGEDYDDTVGPTLTVTLPEYKSGDITISQTSGKKIFTCICDELTEQGIKPVSYNWVLTSVDGIMAVCTNNVFELTDEITKSFKNGVYVLSVIVFDDNNNMYAATASITVTNADQEPVQNIKQGSSVTVSFPDYQKDDLLITKTDSQNGITFTSDESILNAKGIKLTSYNWVLSIADSYTSVSTEKSYLFSKDYSSSLTDNGIYVLSLIAMDEEGNMYASTAYLSVFNENGKPIQIEKEDNLIEVRLPEFGASDLVIEQKTITGGGISFSIKDDEGKYADYEICIWALEDEVVSDTTTCELTAAKLSALEDREYALTLFIKTKDGVYADATIYISK